MNFQKQIVELQKVRKQIDKYSVELAEDNGISANLTDTSYSITIAIKNLIRLNKVFKERELTEQCGVTKIKKND